MPPGPSPARPLESPAAQKPRVLQPDAVGGPTGTTLEPTTLGPRLPSRRARSTRGLRRTSFTGARTTSSTTPDSQTSERDRHFVPRRGLGLRVVSGVQGRRQTIIKRLVDAGVELRAAKHGLPDCELETIVGFRAAGWTLNQIGEHYERSGTAIRKYLLRHDALEAHATR